jgi:hypothetical protein
MGKKKPAAANPAGEVAELKGQLKTANEQLAEANRTIDTLRKDKQKVERDSVNLAEEKARLVDSLEKAKTTLQDQSRQLLTNREEWAELNGKIAEHDERRKTDAQRITELDGMLQHSQRAVDARNSQIIEMQNELDAAEAKANWRRTANWLLTAALLILLLIMFGKSADAQQTASYQWDDPKLALHVPQEILQKFRNPDGSCVQCSEGMTGTDQNVGAFAYLLWDSEYGKRVRGGSSPSRVANYAKERNVRIYNVTGKNTWDWMRWACQNGRGAAIGAGGNHFQTLVGHDPATNKWYVVNNNGDQRIQEYDDAAFRRLHLASGQWCVILDYPPAPAPARIVQWWREPEQVAANPPPAQ